jgi:hypothetical protein
LLHERTATGARVADCLAETLHQGPEATLALARSYSSEEIALGLTFLTTVIEVAALSARTLAEVVEERRHPSSTGAWH